MTKAIFALLLVAASACAQTTGPIGPGGPSGAGGSESRPAEARSTSAEEKTPPPSETAPAPKPTAAAAETEAPKKIGARHVLVQWMGSERAASSIVRTRDQALSLAKEVHRRAKSGEDFARLAVEYSDEPNAAARGGSLGRFSRGQMVGAFEEAAFKLKVGEISEIIETPFGFHVIQRTE